ncbi:MAG: H-NS histone family protein [Pseudomonadota bacterium]
MQSNFNELSESELQSVIKNAERALTARKESKRKEVIAKIKELAASVGVSVDIVEPGKRAARKGVKVPIKYRNPENPAEVWTGRGMKPKWLRGKLESGRNIEEFKI